MTAAKTPELFVVLDVPVGELHVNERNPRTITKGRFQALVKAMDAEPQMMRARPLIALPDGTVIAGNMRLRGAQELGWETVPTLYADLNDQRAKEWLLRDNQPYGEWQDDELAELMFELRLRGSYLELTGFVDDDIERLLEQVSGDDNGGPPGTADKLAMLKVTLDDPEHSVTRGDVIDVGPHVLVCAPVYDGWPVYTPLLQDGDLLVPYPTPIVPLTERAKAGGRLVMVQPDSWLAGHLLDKYAQVMGDDKINRR